MDLGKAGPRGIWVCTHCTFHNVKENSTCEICSKPHLKRGLDTSDTLVDTGIDVLETIPGEWACPYCTFDNPMVNSNCQMCSKSNKRRRLDEGHENIYQPAISDKINSMTPDKELRLVLIGRTGAGKSATANTILGSNKFHSELNSNLVTKVCKMEIANVAGRKLAVVDTPGFDMGMDKEIVKCISMTAPGPHAIILVVGVGRFSKGEQDTLMKLKETFGKRMTDYLIVLFTNKDQLDIHGQSIETFVMEAQSELKQIIGECNNRYIAFNNMGTPEEKQRQSHELIRLIDRMLRYNDGMYYTSEHFKEAEVDLQRKEAKHAIKNEFERKHMVEIQGNEKQIQNEQDGETQEDKTIKELPTAEYEDDAKSHLQGQQLTYQDEEREEETREENEEREETREENEEREETRKENGEYTQQAEEEDFQEQTQDEIGKSENQDNKRCYIM